jgi:Flp pilus assembly protein TadG
MKILRRHRTKSRVRNDETGVIIVLVAVVMLGVVGAMAALSIDVVTLYTARSEAQLAADAAALAGARALANSGATSDTTGTLMPAAQVLAQTVALQVAERNQVGGAFLTAANVAAPTFGGTNPNANPTITVKVQVTNLPAFFARIWGGGLLSVTATATAEAYNPSGGVGGAATSGPPVAPICVKPWLIPNIDPTSAAPPATPTTIFDPATGAITNPALLGYLSNITKPIGLPPLSQFPNTQLSDGTAQTTMAPWKFYPGDPASTFAPPTQSLPTCTPAITTPYQQSVAGCIQTPISCNSFANLDLSGINTPNQTGHAVNCLAHSRNDKGDVSSNPYPLAAPFEFIAGDDNPVALAEPKFAGEQVMTSDSLVTVPVFNNTGTAAPPTSPVQIIGFVQLFVNPDGLHTKNFNSPTGYAGYVTTQIVNMVGCGTAGATGTPILGNGASPVAVRLISP